MKRTLTALTALALLFPLSVNAASMGKEKSEEIMYYGEVMSVRQKGPISYFIIKYQKSIFECTFIPAINNTYVAIHCDDTER